MLGRLDERPRRTRQRRLRPLSQPRAAGSRGCWTGEAFTPRLARLDLGRHPVKTHGGGILGVLNGCSPDRLPSPHPAHCGQHERHQEGAAGPTAACAGWLTGRRGVAGVADPVAIRVGLIRVRCVGTVVQAVDEAVSVRVVVGGSAATASWWVPLRRTGPRCHQEHRLRLLRPVRF